MRDALIGAFGRVWAMDRRALDKLALFLFGARPAADVSAQVVAAIEAGRKQRDASAAEIVGGVATIPIKGVILKSVPWIFDWLGVEATSTDSAKRQLAEAIGSNDVSAIRLHVDSPGGTVDGVQELADAVRAARAQKPVTADVENMAASAAYWIASQASSIKANRAAEIGSIGVYTVVDDFSRAYENEGIKTNVVSSAPLKGAGVEGAPVTAEQIADVQRVIDGFAALFVDAVAAGRSGRMTHEQVKDHATGQTWLADEAMAAGLIDGLTNQETAPVRGNQPAAVAAEESAMDPKELEALKARAEKAEAEAKNAQIEAEAARKQSAEMLAHNRDTLIAKYADRITPADRSDVVGMVEKFGADLAGAEKMLSRLQVVTLPKRESADVQPAAVAIPSGSPSLGESDLCKVMGQTPARMREMSAVGDAVDHVEHEHVVDANGREIMRPVAVLKDGRRMSKADLHQTLGLKGAMIALLVGVAAMVAAPRDVHATALSAARATECKWAGNVKQYLMPVSHTIYAGSLVMIDSAGKAHAAESSASNHGVAGVAQETKTSASSGSTYIKVSDGVLCKFAGTTLAQTGVGLVVYAEDDQTVDETVGTNEPVAGILMDYVDASTGWVYVSSAVNEGRTNVVTEPLVLTDVLTLSNAEIIANGTNGEIELRGAGGTNNEHLSLNFETTSNTVALSSDTGVVALDLGGPSHTIILDNDQVIGSGTDEQIEIGDSEHVTFDFSVSNTLTLSSDTSVAAIDFGALGTTLTLANDQFISSTTNEILEIGDTEHISLDFTGSNALVLSSDTGVVNVDFGAVGTTLTLANDQEIRSGTNNAISLYENSEDLVLTFNNNSIALSSNTSVTDLDVGAVQLTSSATNDFGWAIVAAGNQACNTTCTHACVVGFDDGAADAETMVGCTDATADKCLCAGAD